MPLPNSNRTLACSVARERYVQHLIQRQALDCVNQTPEGNVPEWGVKNEPKTHLLLKWCHKIISVQIVDLLVSWPLRCWSDTASEHSVWSEAPCASNCTWSNWRTLGSLMWWSEKRNNGGYLWPWAVERSTLEPLSFQLLPNRFQLKTWKTLWKS